MAGLRTMSGTGIFLRYKGWFVIDAFFFTCHMKLRMEENVTRHPQLEQGMVWRLIQVCLEKPVSFIPKRKEHC